MGWFPTIVWTVRLVHVYSVCKPNQKQMGVGNAKTYLAEEVWVSDDLKKLVVRAYLSWPMQAYFLIANTEVRGFYSQFSSAKCQHDLY